MKEERFFVLKMIDEGKISANEGVKLLKALRHDEKVLKKTEVEDKLSKAAKTVDAFAKDLRVKVEEFAKDAEPKVREASRFVLDKTSTAFDEIGKTIKNVMDPTSKDEDDDEFEVVFEDKSEEE